MKIYADGDALDSKEHKVIRHERVVGLIDLNVDNNYENYGLSGVKAVVRSDDQLYLIDLPEQSYLYTQDDVLITKGQFWWPDVRDAEKYDLFIFEKGRSYE